MKFLLKFAAALRKKLLTHSFAAQPKKRGCTPILFFSVYTTAYYKERYNRDAIASLTIDMNDMGF